MKRRVEEDLFPVPAPLAGLALANEVKGTMVVSSLLGVREGGHHDRYVAKLAPAHREAISLIVAGEWVPMELAVAHYRACDSLGLPPWEIARMGGAMARRLNSNLFGMLLKLAKTSGVTPWSALAHLQRVFEANFRGGGGTRVVKVGPKEARVEMAALPILGIPWCRHGWRGMFATNAELFCNRCYVTELASTATSVAFRLAWV